MESIDIFRGQGLKPFYKYNNLSQKLRTSRSQGEGRFCKSQKLVHTEGNGSKKAKNCKRPLCYGRPLVIVS